MAALALAFAAAAIVADDTSFTPFSVDVRVPVAVPADDSRRHLIFDFVVAVVAEFWVDLFWVSRTPPLVGAKYLCRKKPHSHS